MAGRGSILFVLAAALGLGVALTAGSAYGQPAFGRRGTNPYLRPPTSPYLNLLRRDIPFGFNYFRSVRPELEFRRANVQQFRSLQSIQRQVQEQERLLRQSPTSRLSPTGHQVNFLNLGGYFNTGPSNIGTGSSIGARPIGPR